MVAEVDEVLVRHRDETLVEDGQAADAGVEDAYGPRIHCAHRKWALALRLVGRVRVVLAVARRGARLRRGRVGCVRRLDRGHDQRLGLDAARVRLHHPERHRAGRRLARRHPLPRARRSRTRTWSRSARRWRSSASPRSPATRAAPAPPAASSGSTGRRRCRTRRTSSTGSPPRPTSRTRRSEPSGSRSAAGRSGTRRSPAFRSRRSCRRSRGRTSEPRSTRTACRRRAVRIARSGRARLATGIRPSPRPSRTCSGQRHGGGHERGGGPLLAVAAPRAHRADPAAAGTARLPLRHGPGDRRVQAARRAEAALPRRPRPRTGEEPGRRADGSTSEADHRWFSHYLAGGTDAAAASSSRTIRGTGRRRRTRSCRRPATASVNLPGQDGFIRGPHVAYRSARLTGGPLETFGDGSVTVRYSGAELGAPRGDGLGQGDAARR